MCLLSPESLVDCLPPPLQKICKVFCYFAPLYTFQTVKLILRFRPITYKAIDKESPASVYALSGGGFAINTLLF